MSYTLYNKATGQTLDLKGMTWTCETIDEAFDMLDACRKCADTFEGCDRNNFVVIDAEAGEVVLERPHSTTA